MQRWLLIFTILATFVPSLASADPDQCAPTQTVDPLRLLRQASLDLRGAIPTYDEYEAVRQAPDPEAEVEARIAAMLVSEEFFTTVREYHRDLMWSAMDESIIDQLFQAGRRIALVTATQTWRSTQAAAWFRGDNSVTCLDQLQTQFDGAGRPIPISTYADPICDSNGAGGTCTQEGYVMVEPYWAPGTQVKVCAFDAQALEGGEDGDSCALYQTNDPGCGCGPNLQHCGRQAAGLSDEFRAALSEEPLRIFEGIVRANLPYFEAFTTDLTYVNGTLAHYYRYMTGLHDEDANGVVYDAAVDQFPDLVYGDEQWVAVDRDPHHAGVLTTYGFLGRFASNRARANRFFTAFYCDPFVPPEDGLPPQEAEPNPNLRERTGCDGCHSELEPAAAHWGRWRSGGTHGLLREETMSFEEPRDNCQCGAGTDTPTCNLMCRTYYVTADNSHPDEYAQFGGMPLASAWLQEGELANVETGPSRLVESPAQRRAVAQCMVKTLAEHLLGRPMESDDLTWIDDHTEVLEADGYRFSTMVQRMVQDERYRSID